jgi:hypothetical protein
MTIHAFILTLSAGAVVRTFYLIPKQSGLMKPIEFSEEVRMRV